MFLAMCYIRYSAHSPILDAISSVLQNRADHLTHLLVLWVLGAYNIHSSLPEIVSMSLALNIVATHLLTTEHPSQNFLTLDLTFIPLN
jgi:hypothetical protein